MEARPGERFALFDLDGTLTDPEIGITRCVDHALDALGLPVPDPATIRTFIGPPIRDAFIMMGVPPSQVEEAVERYRDRYSPIGMYENEVIPGVVGCLDRLEDAGVVLGVATSKVEVYAFEILEHFGLASRFAAISGCDFDGTNADKADIVARCLAGLGTDGRSAVMVGDRRHDVVGAATCGLPTVGVTWGFGTEGELRDAGATAIVTDVNELADAVLGLL
jgi:phosphoglycolate phosphatase